MTRIRRGAGLAILLCAFAGWSPAAGAADYTVAPSDSPAEGLQAVLDSASPGDTIRVRGTWTGNFAITVPVTLLSGGGGIDAEQSGIALRVLAPETLVQGLAIRGSGDDLRGPDSGIWVGPDAAGAVLRGNTIDDCAFGIWVHQTVGARVVENVIHGRKDIHPSNRGNGIHLFDCDSALVADNHIVGARDGIYISATENSVFEGNLCEEQRFGVHYMFSHGNTLRNNSARNNKHGFALMQSSDMIVEGNHASGSTGHGILFRDAQRCIIRGNELIDNVEGLFFYSSTENEIYDNHIEGNGVGAKIWAGTLRNQIHDNRFVGNRQQVFYVSASDLVIGEDGRGNYWSDYLGWDQDGDGVGDRPYRVDSFTANLLFRFPSTAVLMRSPALELLSHLQATMPLLKTPTLIDRSPLIGRAAP